MSKTNDKYLLAEHPMNEALGHFVLNPLTGMVWKVFNYDTVEDIFSERFQAVGGYVNPDGVMEWIGLRQMSDVDGAAEASAALDWYLAYLRWEDGDTALFFRPYRPDMPYTFAFRAHDREAYALLHMGGIERFDDVLDMATRISELNPGLPELPGTINSIAWPAR